MTDKPVFNEIATIDKDITIPQFGGVLRHNDDTLLTRGQGKGLKIYDDIERDCHAYAVLQKRKMAVIAREWLVIPASESALDKKAADMVKAQLQNMQGGAQDDGILPQAAGFDAVCLNLLDAILKGYSAGEIMWATDGNEIVASEVRPKEQRRFTFTKGERGYRLNLLTFQDIYKGEPVPPRKFIVHSFGAKDGNPLGLGLGNKLFWPVFFKRQDITFWLTFVDKFASPTAIGKYPVGTLKPEQDKLLAALQAITSEAGVTIPEGMLIEYLEASRAGSIDTYEKLARYMDEQISECVLGETMSTSAKAAGLGSNQAEVHNEVRLELVKADADLLSGSINSSLVRWITALNMPDANPPKVWRVVDAPEDLKLQAERDGTLARDAGVKFTVSYFNRAYGFEQGDIESVGNPAGAGFKPAPANMSFAERKKCPVCFSDGSVQEKDTVDGVTERLMDQADLNPLIAPIKKLADEAKSLEDLRDKILDAYKDMDAVDLGNLMQQAFMVADLSGRFETKQG